jgi:hypothetical protein
MVEKTITRKGDKAKPSRKPRRSRSAAREAAVAPVETATDERVREAAESIEASNRRGKALDRLFDAQALINSLLSGLHPERDVDGRWRLTLDDGELSARRRTLRMATEVLDRAHDELEAELSGLSV